MTTYSHQLILDNSEIIMLRASLKLMIEKCEAVLKEAEINPHKIIAPYFAYKIDAENLVNRLYEKRTLTSKSNF